MTLEIKPRNKYMGHSTGNDLESNDILDFSDNCENLDVLMNADQEYWTDRLGNKRPTIDYALRMAGFTPAGFDFTTGGVLKNGDRNKCVFNQADQTWYSWSGDLPYNVIAGSAPEEGWKVVNNDSNTYLYPEMFGALSHQSDLDTQAIIRCFEMSEALGINIRLKRNYICNESIVLKNFISEVTGVSQGLSGIIFGPGKGLKIDNSGLEIIRKPVKMSSLTLRSNGDREGIALDFTGVRNVRYGPQLECRSITITSIDGQPKSFQKIFKLTAAGESIFDFVTVSGTSSKKIPIIFDLHSSKDVKVINGSYSDFETFMEAHDDTEGVVVSFNHIIAGYRGVISNNNVGNLFTIIGNHFNTSLSAVELGEGIGNGSNHCKITDNFCMVFNVLEHLNIPYVGFDVCSNHNSFSNNEFLLTGFNKDSTGIVLRTSSNGLRKATGNSISKSIGTQITRNVHIRPGATGNHISGNVRTGMNLDTDIIDEGENTKYWLFDSDINSFLTGDIKLSRLHEAGVRQIRAHTSGSLLTPDGVLRFIGGENGNPNQGIAEFTFREVVTKLIRPSTSNTYSCGAPGAPWAGGYTQTAFTITSDERLKTRPIDIANEILDAWNEVDFYSYQFIDRVLTKGEDKARWHFGVIAQRVKEVFERRGLDPFKHAILCFDKWEETDEIWDITPELLDGDGEIILPEKRELIQPYIPAGDCFRLNYEEALILEAKLQRRKYCELDARLSALENK